jgi:hypothetical protein
MTKKKRRRRRPARLGSDESAGSGSAMPATTARRRGPAPLRSTPREERASAVGEERRRGRGAAAGVVHPPAPQSIARGLAAVGGSPAILLTSFLAVLGLWAAFASYATMLAAVPPGRMSLFESLPPLHCLLVDLELLASSRTAPAPVALAFGLAVVLYRAAFSSLWISLIVDRFGNGEPRLSTETSAVRSVGARTAGSLLAVLGLELGFLTLSVVSVFVAGSFLGAGFGQLAVMAALIGGMYFFIFAPVIAVMERVSPRAAVRLAILTARIPGPRHLVFTVGYIAVSLLVLQFAPGGTLSTATPPISVWAYVLFVNLLHLSAQAALVYRWLSVRPHILA